MKRRVFLVAAAAVLAARHAAAQTGAEPVEVVKGWFHPKAQAPIGGYSTRMRKLLDADRKRAVEGEGANLDFDWLTNGQDEAEIADLTIEVTSKSGVKPSILVRFNNHGRPIERIVTFAKEKGRWVIDEVSMTSENTSLSKILRGE